MSIYINNNHGTVYNECTVTIQNGQVTVQEAEEVDSTTVSPSPYPQENDYTGLVTWLEAQKTKGIDYYAAADMNRSKMCRELSDILGWTVDQNSLRKAQQR